MPWKTFRRFFHAMEDFRPPVEKFSTGGKRASRAGGSVGFEGLGEVGEEEELAGVAPAVFGLGEHGAQAGGHLQGGQGEDA